MATELGVGFRVTSGPVLARPGDLAALLTDLNEHDVLFIDEIHRLPRLVEEVLYPAMEDGKLDIVIGKGPSAREELKEIVLRSATLLDVMIDEGGAERIAGRSRGTPRIANRLLRRVRDFVQVRGDGTITVQAADQGLALFGVDDRGLDKVDRMILEILCVRFGGHPVGLTTLAQSVGEEPGTIEDAYEPYLVQQGFIRRTPRGRIGTEQALAHLGLTQTLPNLEN